MQIMLVMTDYAKNYASTIYQSLVMGTENQNNNWDIENDIH